METITIRNLQHYLYCPHRWGLIEIDRAWSENYFVVKANLMHSRVHSGESYALRGRKVYTSLDIWNDSLGLTGKADCIEEAGGNYCLVEYKPKKPKECIITDDNAMQLFAQKLCVDQTLHTSCETVMYYTDVKKRFPIDFSSDYEKKIRELTRITEEMRHYMRNGYIPPVSLKQRCSGCSIGEQQMMSKHRQVRLRKPMVCVRNGIKQHAIRHSPPCMVCAIASHSHDIAVAPHTGCVS